MTTPSSFLDSVHNKIRLKHYSTRTEQAYLDWIKRFILHFDKRHPKDLGVPVYRTAISIFTGLQPWWYLLRVRYLARFAQ